MSDSSGNENDFSNESGNSTEAPEENGQKDKFAVREFLYLDFSKLVSYHAQFSEGRITKSERHERFDVTDGVTGRSVNATVETSAGAKAGNADPAAANLLNLLGITSRIDARLSFLIQGGRRDSTITDSSYEVATKELHHEIFADIEDAFELQELISYDDDISFDKPFHIITGYADFIDFNYLANSIEDFENLRQNIGIISG